MNEHLKKLAEQAGYNHIFEGDTIARGRLEKYTALLIQTVLNISNEHADLQGPHNPSMADGIRLNNELIAQYFEHDTNTTR